MASKKHDDAKKKRDSAKRKRDAALAVIRTGKNKDGSTASGAQIAAARQRESTHASTMRLHGDIMRAETGREKGQRTTYTGPIGVEARTERGLPAETDWQKVNLRWLQDIQAANPNWTITQARNELKRMFADDRPGYLAEQQRRMDAGEKVEFPEGDVVTSVDGPVRGSGVGGPGLLGPFSPGGRMPAGYGGYGGYPVLSLGTPSGASYPAAAEAAEGYAGALGFNIGPEGGLVYRPWEARAWQQTGIDPNLWNAPFANTGLLSGYVPPTTADTTPVPTATTVPTGTTTADAGPTFHETFMAPGGGHEQALQRLYAAAGGDAVWGSYPNWFNRTGGAKTTTAGDAPDFSFEDWKAGPLSRAVADQARENAFLQQSAIPVTAQGAFGPSADALAAAQAAAARTPYSYTPPTMAGPIPVPSVYTAPSWAQTGLLPPTTSGFVSDF